MYQGAFEKKRTPVKKRRRRGRKPTLLMMALVIALGAFVGTTLAYLVTNTAAVANTFNPVKVSTDIDEPGWDGEVKNNVTVKNTGDISAYIRAAVVITWQDDAGNVHPDTPAQGTDYTITWTRAGWAEKNGFYYYTSPVAPNQSTGVLLTGCTPIEGKAPAGYHLSVEILSSAIQSEPKSVVTEAWKVSVNADGTLNVGGST